MKINLRHSLILYASYAGAAAAQTPVPQEPTDRPGSPYDRNPACRDRDVASTDPACVIQDGRPRVQQFGFDSVKPIPPGPAPRPQTVQPPAQPPAVQPQGSSAPPVIIVTPPMESSPTLR